MRGWWRVGAVMVLVVAVATVSGCGRRGAGVDDGLGEDGFGPGGRGVGASSLERARRGLAPEEDGVLADVRFGYDSTDVDGTGRAALERNLEWLRENRRAKVELEGHADSRGTIEYNLALGAKRAKAVKDYLVSNGVTPDRLSTISYGEELPLCQEEREECWARNRRVHSVVLGQ